MEDIKSCKECGLPVKAGALCASCKNRARAVQQAEAGLTCSSCGLVPSGQKYLLGFKTTGKYWCAKCWVAHKRAEDPDYGKPKVPECVKCGAEHQRAGSLCHACWNRVQAARQAREGVRCASCFRAPVNTPFAGASVGMFWCGNCAKKLRRSGLSPADAHRQVESKQGRAKKAGRPVAPGADDAYVGFMRRRRARLEARGAGGLGRLVGPVPR